MTQQPQQFLSQNSVAVESRTQTEHVDSTARQSTATLAASASFRGAPDADDAWVAVNNS